jgi:hypothetical protein
VLCFYAFQGCRQKFSCRLEMNVFILLHPSPITELDRHGATCSLNDPCNTADIYSGSFLGPVIDDTHALYLWLDKVGRRSMQLKNI